MSQIIHAVTQTEQEYHDFQQKKARKRMANVMLALFIFVVGMGSICHLAGFFNG